MKNIPILLLTALLCLIVFSSCSEGAEQHTISNYDTISNISVEVSENGNDIEMTGDFSVKEKIYAYEGTNLAILDITNNTNKDFAVTISCTYLDKNGAEIQTETQNFPWFSAGLKNCFLFKPDIVFDSLTYQLEFTEPTEPMYAKNIVSAVDVIKEGRNGTINPITNEVIFHPSLLSWQGHSNGNDIPLMIGAWWLYFNENGDILFIIHKTDIYTPNPAHPEMGSFYEEYNTVPLYTDKTGIFGKDKLELPEQWQGELTALACIDSITVADEEYLP